MTKAVSPRAAQIFVTMTQNCDKSKNDADDAVNGSTYRPVLDNTADVVKILIGFSVSTLRSKSKLSNEAENDQTSTVHLYKKRPFISSIDAARNESNRINIRCEKKLSIIYRNWPRKKIRKNF